MAGIQLYQPNGAGLLNAAGDPHPAPVTIEVGILCQLSPAGVDSATWRWVLSKPGTSASVLSSTTSDGPSFMPDIEDGSYSISLFDIDENEYILDIVTPTTGGGGGGGGGGGTVSTSVNTYAAVRAAGAFGSSPPSVLLVRSRETVDDGGGGMFAYDSSDTTTADDDGVVLVGAGGERFKRIRENVIDPRWYGVKADNSSNDAAAWAAVFASLGISTRMRPGYIQAPNETSVVNSTIELTRFSGVLSGAGAGTAVGGTGAIRWNGTTSDPLLRLQRCWGTHIENLRLIGKLANPPSAAIDIYTEIPNSPYNTKLSLENLWIGGISGEDTIIQPGFERGIVFSGDPVQNDQSKIDKCMIQDVEFVGIDIQTAQSSHIEISNCTINSVPTGIQTISRNLLVRNCFFATVTDCVLLTADSDVQINNFGAEGCARLLRATGGTGSGISIRGGYFQCNPLTSGVAGNFIEIDGGNSPVYLTIEDFNVSHNGSMSPGEAKIKIVNCSHLMLVCRSVHWYDDLRLIDHLDIEATGTAGESRLVIWEHEGEPYVNYWEHGAHANAQLGERTDLANGATLAPDESLSVITPAGATRSLAKWNSTGPFANYLELGDSVAKVAIANDLRARSAGLDVQDFRNITGVLGYLEWAASLGTVKVIPNNGSPEAVVTAPPGSLCLDYGTPALFQKITGTGNTGWATVVSLSGGRKIVEGSDTPEGNFIGEVGDLFLRDDGGQSTSLYTKTSGSGSSGWSNVATLGSGRRMLTGTSTPEAAVTGIVGDFFDRTDGATSQVLYAKVSGTGNTGWENVYTGLYEAQLTRVCRHLPAFMTPSLWSIDTSGRVTCGTTAGDSAIYDLDLPDGVTVDTIELTVIGGGNVALPGVMPLFRLRRYVIASDTTITSSDAVDGSATVGAYNAIHTITMSGIGLSVSNSSRWVVDFVSESGANAVVGFMILGVKVTMTTRLDQLDRGSA